LRVIRPFLLAVAVLALGAVVAPAKTSHDGWPTFDGTVYINHDDANVTKHGTSKSDELLGGHGNDQLYGEGAADVLWGDQKPSGQPTTQFDHLYGGAGGDFIYASHGHNVIDAGADNDYVKAHYGYGTIDCGAGKDQLYISHKAQKKYTIKHCETISHKSLGF
jgi:Ca2+-binding RTX toxin-like protein